MKSSLPYLLVLAFALSGFRLQAQEEAPKSTLPQYEDDHIPESYKDYLVFRKSPNKRYGLISLKQSLLNVDRENHVFLVALEPFRMLTAIPLVGSDLERGHSWHDEFWAKDSSAVLLIEGAKWGPASVFVVPIHGRKAGRPVELTSKIRKMVLSDFKRSKAARYNDYFDFVFDGGYFADPPWQPVEIDDNWSFNDQGQVVVACVCTTDPKRLAQHSWSVRFDGVWDVAQGKFIQASFVRLKEGNLLDYFGR